ncbi:MAG TPA: DUF1178 family protein [Acetobacteraceae bacterium]|nr:DUF1178 family protein [Acetobacteraceae bacterium]
MIHYQLRCAQRHEFDGWFQSSAAFDRQAKAGLVECPICGDVTVARAMMAPAVATRDAAPGGAPGAAPVPPEAPPPAMPAAEPAVAASGPMPAHIRAMLQRLRSEVEKHCDYVGPAFAEEARKMHRGESDKHGIYGETTPSEAEALAEEGIEVARMPWVPRAEG